MKLTGLATYSKEEGVWVVLCLEHYIASQGRNILEALTDLVMTIEAEILFDEEQGNEPLKRIPAAPHKYQSLYREGMLMFNTLPSDFENMKPDLQDIRLAA